MNMAAVHQMVDRVSALLQEKHGLRGPTLAARLRRGRRLLPRPVREAAERLARAEENLGNPRLWGQIDLGRLTQDYDACITHLAAIDLGARRRGRLMGMLESVGTGVFVMAIVMTVVMVWR